MDAVLLTSIHYISCASTVPQPLHLTVNRMQTAIVTSKPQQFLGRNTLAMHCAYRSLVPA
jgi:hypothetical protein